MKPKATLRHFLALAGSSLLAISSASAQAVNGTWNVDAAGNWGTASNWLSNPVDEVPGGQGSIVGLTNNITAARTVTIDTDSRTVGALTIGDSAPSHYFTLAASGGAGLTFDNNGSGATLTSTTTLSTLTTARDTISAPITLAENLAVSVAGTYSGGISSAGYLGITGNIDESGGVRSITKNGNGALILTGNNSYTGGFTLNEGSVQVTINSGEVNNSYTGFGTGTLTINGGTIATRSNGSFTTANNSVWNGNFSLYRGQTGAVTWNHQGNVTLGGNITVTSPNNSYFLNIGGIIGETGGPRSLTLGSGSLTTTLSGNNTYTGGTNVTAGTLQFAKPAAMSATGTVAMSSGATLSVNAGGAGEFTGATSGNGSIGGLLDDSAVGGQGAPVTWAGTARLGIDTTNAAGGSLTYSGTIVNRGTTMGILKTGVGNLVLDQDNTYTGVTTIVQGNLVAGSNSPSGAAGAFGSTTSDLALGVALSNNAAGILINGAHTIGRNIRNATNNDTDNGTRVLTLGGNSAHNSEFSGNIFLGTSGQTSKGIHLAAAAGGQVTFSGIIQETGGTRTAAEINAAAALVSVTKVGAGTVVLSNTNTYTGATAITEGTLKLGANDVLPDGSALTIGTATLDADTRTDTVGTLNVTGSAVINLGTGAALAFANSSSVGSGDWEGTLNLVGFVSGSSLNFGSSSGLTSAQLDKISAAGFSNFSLDAGGNLIADSGGGPGPLDKFAISAISSPQTVGTPITGITITAQDASNQTITSFNGTVTFSGTGGFSGTSATFSSGVLSGVSVTPTNAGSNLTFVVTDGVSGKTGSTTIATIQSQYQAWASGAAFDADANGDGISNGLAFLLGASGPNVSALDKLPTVSQSGGNLVLSFQALKDAYRGSASLSVEHSSDLGISDAWLAALVSDAGTPANNVTFSITSASTTLNNVTATISSSEANAGKLFGRVKAVNP
jgi:fibronectin-binding autotransporter adhesin